MTEQVRVLIADDQAHVRQGLQAVLAAWPEINVVAAGASGVGIAPLVERYQPTVALTDLPMPGLPGCKDEGLDGLEVIRLIKTRWPQVRLVVLTMYTARRVAALAAGADAFLLKGCTVEAIRDALLQPGKTVKDPITPVTEVRRPLPSAS